MDLDDDGTLIGIEIINPNREWPLDQICDQFGMSQKCRELAERLMPSGEAETLYSQSLLVTRWVVHDPESSEWAIPAG